MILFPHAKLNLGLRVLGERADGYHEIQSLLYPIGLCDMLELIPRKGAREPLLTVSGDQGHEADDDDLLYRAYRELPASLKGTVPRMHLHKKIPLGAGLGGGSSDAAYLLRYYGAKGSYDPFTPEDPLREAAQNVGSDAPFFLQDEPVIVSGRGEKMKPFDPGLEGYHLLLLVPPIRADTGAVYAELGESSRKDPDLEEKLRLPLSRWKEGVENELEEAAFRLYPELKELKEKLDRAGASYASMTGSGSGVFGLFEEEAPDLEGTEHCFRWTERLSSLT